MDFNVATLHEAIAAAVPDRECVVFRDRRLSWADVTDRTRRLASVLLDHGLGHRVDEGTTDPWESPHDQVALYLHNGNEYLEGMLGAYKARTAPFNVNWMFHGAGKHQFYVKVIDAAGNETVTSTSFTSR